MKNAVALSYEHLSEGGLAKIVLLVPAYNPGPPLIQFLDATIELGYEAIIVVNDGSKAECAEIFEQVKRRPQCVLLNHAVNLGKGRALKTGMNYFLLHFPYSTGVVTADADGQHTPADAVRIGEAIAENPDKLVLGVRQFGEAVPLRSLIGNVVTKYFAALLMGRVVSDTQTGLRGIPRSAVPALLRLDGECYEYEMNMLLNANKRSIEVTERPIQTVYVDNNSSSHFNPLRDSMKVYYVLFRYALSSSMSALVDLGVFALCFSISGSIILSLAIARFLVSPLINFVTNKFLVFHNRENTRGPLLKYCALLIFIATCSYISIKVVVFYFGINVILAKVIVESLLFVISFTVQKTFVFANQPRVKAH
jgi:glycosyltransferase involved in cell wall biosynthesis